jgi:hypothetical protein
MLESTHFRNLLTLAHTMLATIESGKSFDSETWDKNLASMESALKIDSSRARFFVPTPVKTCVGCHYDWCHVFTDSRDAEGIPEEPPASV